jgi:hypothetical protein
VLHFIDWAAQQYHVDPKLLEGIAQRESNFNTGAIENKTDSNARAGTPSKGMFQFIEPTFKGYAPSAQKANPQAWRSAGLVGQPQWLDWRAQALSAAWAISAGHGSAWSTYDSAKAAAH